MSESKYITASDFYKSLFGSKVYKISIDGGCTCPNRDGTKGTGGCSFCSTSGSGDFTSSRNLSITNQIEQAKNLVRQKIPKNAPQKFIVYFQNFTNTYGNLEKLSAMWLEGISCPDIYGLALGTRPDCVNEGVLNVLKPISEKTFVQLELGLQTSNQATADSFNRCYENQEYLDCVELIKKICPKIHIVTHIIFGLPHETKKDMMDSVRFAVDSGIHGIKITSLYVLKNTKLEQQYLKKDFDVLEMDEYLALLKDALRLIPEGMVIHRLSGDPPKILITAPLWTCNKKKVLSEINRILGV